MKIPEVNSKLMSQFIGKARARQVFSTSRSRSFIPDLFSKASNNAFKYEFDPTLSQFEDVVVPKTDKSALEKYNSEIVTDPSQVRAKTNHMARRKKMNESRLQAKRNSDYQSQHHKTDAGKDSRPITHSNFDIR